MSSAAPRMRPADSILWRIEQDPVLRSTVTAVSILDRSPDWPRLRERMLAASLTVPRMREVVVEPTLGVGAPSWAPVTHFDLDYHLRRVQLAQPTTIEAVLDFAAHEAMGDFDRSRPLWEFTLVDGVGDGAVFIQKFHHAVTDGVGGIRLALEILDVEREPAEDKLAGIVVEDLGEPEPDDPFDKFRQALVDSAEAAEKVTRQVARFELSLASALARATRRPLQAASTVSESVKWGAKLVAPVTEPLSPVMRDRSTTLRFAAFDVDLGSLRTAGRSVGGTLNDAFIAAVAIGLHHYHERHGKPVAELRMTLPVNIRDESDPLGGNRFTPIRFPVPVSPANPAAIMTAIDRIVTEWRSGPALDLTDSIASVLNTLPTPAVTQLFGSMLRSIDFVATNVPGIPMPVYLAGAELVRQYAFAPPSGSALSVALLSHVGHCCIGVNMDHAAVTDPEVLVDSLRLGFGEVVALGGTAPSRSARPPRAKRAG